MDLIGYYFYHRVLEWITLFVHFSLFSFLILAAAQDYETREVSNWITVPLFFGGVIGILIHLDLLAVLFAILLFVFWVRGQMGGADVKVLVALLGLWINAALAAFVVLGVWGVALLARKKNKAFPGVVAIAVGAGLTFIGELSIMFWN